MLDIRVPIAALFLLIGGLLGLYGLHQPAADYAKALGYDVDLLWGGVMVCFGLAMGLWKLLGERPRAARGKAADGSEAPHEPALR